MTRLVLVAVGVSMLIACHKPDNSPKKDKAEHREASDPRGSAEPATTAAAIHWLHDDYSGALAAARTAGKPLVIDMWAPWCHTCLSMKHFVLGEPTLAEMADRFVWVALDTDKEVNAAVQTKLPVNAWPTFFVVSPVDESVQARHLGAASLEQFREFLLQGEGGHLDLAGAKGSIDPKLAAMRDGDRHTLYGRYDEADAAYARALELGGPSWKRRPEVLVARISSLEQAGKYEPCVDLALAHFGEVTAGKTASAADFAYTAHVCAEHVGAAKAKQVSARAVAADGPIRTVLDAADSRLSVDDRSDAMRILREIEEGRGNADLAHQWAESQRKLLDQAAAKAPDAFARMTYNWPRSEVYVYLGVAEELIPELRKSVEELPDQYDPPYRLAWVYLNTGDYDQALAMAEKALTMVYGPRKARVLALIAETHKARGDHKAERAAREQVVSVYESLGEGHTSPRALERAKKELAAVTGG